MRVRRVSVLWGAWRARLNRRAAASAFPDHACRRTGPAADRQLDHSVTAPSGSTDDNGGLRRTARCIQTAVLASDGTVAPAFSSIEEHIGRNQLAYVASRDLKMLVDAEFLVPEGEKRDRSYLAAPVVRAIRQRSRLPKNVEDPFAEGGPAQPRQESLFPEIA